METEVEALQGRFVLPVRSFVVNGPNFVTALLTSRHTPSGSENMTSPRFMLEIALLYNCPSLSVTPTIISFFFVPI